MHITPFRWLVFERFLCRSHQLDFDDFSFLGDESRMSAFKGAVEEHYRYHQCWGGFSLVIPIFYFGFGRRSCVGHQIDQDYCLLLFIVLESVTAWAAADAYKKYVNRSQKILGAQSFKEVADDGNVPATSLAPAGGASNPRDTSAFAPAGALLSAAITFLFLGMVAGLAMWDYSNRRFRSVSNN